MERRFMIYACVGIGIFGMLPVVGPIAILGLGITALVLLINEFNKTNN